MASVAPPLSASSSSSSLSSLSSSGSSSSLSSFSSTTSSDAPHLDNIQLLIQRKAELAKMRAKVTLTEADGALLLTHSTEVQIPDGHPIYEQGKPVAAAYRVKSGKVGLSRNGHVFLEAGPGWFIGDVILVKGLEKLPNSAIGIKAVGPVTLVKLNLDFVRDLLSVDKSLSMKFFRYLATKYTAVFYHVLSNLSHPSFSPSSSLPSLPASSPTLFPTPAVKAPACSFHHPAPSTRTIYKTYELLPSGSHHHKGVPLIILKPTKLKVMSKLFGMHTKSRIPYDKIESITKIGENAATISHRPKKANTVFFKVDAERDEFVSLVTSLLPNACKNHQPAPVPAEEEASLLTSPSPITEEDQALYDTIAHEETFKKGEYFFQEGDLFQRVYTLTSGSVTVTQGDIVFAHLLPGDIIGVGTLLLLRPALLSAQVTSETATAMVMPAYKLFALMDTHVSIAERVMRNAAAIQTRLCITAFAQMDLMRKQAEEEKGKIEESK